jgi:UDP-hydrolysing UDP-N-acetyl-D-glucosamine 2-epimerase
MRILAVSGSRADWGLLQPVLTLLRDNTLFSLEILLTGQHLSDDGQSLAEIELAGFEVDHQVDMDLRRDDKASNICYSMAKVVEGVGSILNNRRPDIMLVLGDRYEILGAVNAALLSKVPVAHIAGGDITEGAFDDSIRHAITKMSALHFVTTEQAALRIKQMGEMQENVFVTGSPGIDQIISVPRVERTKFFESVGLTDRYPTFLITLHPATLSDNNLAMTNEMLEALKAYSNAGLIFTGSNEDPEADHIDRLIKAFTDSHENAVFHKSLGSSLYFSGLEHCDLVLGNSSSALYEAPSFKIPSVNIGDRQKGRLRAESIIDCKPDSYSICEAIKIALNMDTKCVSNPYGDGTAAEKIVSHLADVVNSTKLIRKSFKDYFDETFLKK